MDACGQQVHAVAQGPADVALDPLEGLVGDGVLGDEALRQHARAEPQRRDLDRLAVDGLHDLDRPAADVDRRRERRLPHLRCRAEPDQPAFLFRRDDLDVDAGLGEDAGDELPAVARPTHRLGRDRAHVRHAETDADVTHGGQRLDRAVDGFGIEHPGRVESLSEARHRLLVVDDVMRAAHGDLDNDRAYGVGADVDRLEAAHRASSAGSAGTSETGAESAVGVGTGAASSAACV